MSSDDPIKKRAEEIRAENEASARGRVSQDADVRSARLELVQRYLDNLTDRTSHPVECVEADTRAHGAVARFSFLKDGKRWTQNMFEFGIARVNGEGEQNAPFYYLVPSSAAFSISNPRSGVARELRESSADEVIEFAVAISIEMMARVVASGGTLGTLAEIDVALADQERHAARRERVAKQDRGRKFWRGCGMAILWFFGFFFVIGLLGSLLRACTGSS